MEKLFSIQTTTNSAIEAKTLAREILARKLAACIQIISGVTSIYEWRSELHETKEWILQIKTGASRVDELIAFIIQAHSYDVPEILVVDVVKTTDAYQNWALSQLSQ